MLLFVVNMLTDTVLIMPYIPHALNFKLLHAESESEVYLKSVRLLNGLFSILKNRFSVRQNSSLEDYVES